ncbi:hypothetical protein EB001_03050 [bacterium]|nr:hypothetical protein [bacterium]
MKYEEYVTKLGTRYDIVNGELTESPSGLFVVSEEFKDYTIYLNKLTRLVSIVAPKASYIGRQYKLRANDCARLFAEWLDNNYNTKYIDYYNKLPLREFYKYHKTGMREWFLDQKFIEIATADMQVGDCLVYRNNKEVLLHVGICVLPGKILHHIPQKLSCIDDINLDSVLGVYRYGN